MRFFVCFLFLCSIASPAFSSDSDRVHFGLQTSVNSYVVDDPAGPTNAGSGVSLSLIALASLEEDLRAMFNIDMNSFKLPGSTTNVGQKVSGFGAGASIQKQLDVTSSWHPWLGGGLGLTSTTYKNRFTYTSGTQAYQYLYADRTVRDIPLLLNANSEWALYRDWEFGVQAQLSKSFINKSSTFRVGIYVVY